ncbi:MAG: hypothetical protein E5X34_29510 [Mesorhizobium sp.]|nr:MAG: hypothetical protein E5X34_29510 [Mesorhizobium sp.]
MRWGRGGSAKPRRRGGAPFEGPSPSASRTPLPASGGARNPKLHQVGGTAPPSALPGISPTRGEIGSFRAAL